MADAENIDDIAEAPKKNNTLIIIIIALVNVAILAVVLVVVLGGGGEKDSDSGDGGGKRETRSNKIDGPIVPLDGFVVNLSNSREYKYLKTEISVQLFSETDSEFFEKQRAIVRNEVLLQLSGIEIESLQTMESKQQLETDLADAVNKRMDMDRIAKVYFTEFVVQ